MKALEKIYRTTTYLDERKRGDVKWKNKPVAGAENIEYTRTDALMKKAVEFMKNANLYLYHCISEECDYVDTDKFIDDFKKYVKGE
jgi:hypothetical protein